MRPPRGRTKTSKFRHLQRSIDARVETSAESPWHEYSSGEECSQVHQDFVMAKRFEKTLEARGLIISGPATCGKSTVAAEIEKLTGCNRIEGDDLHTAKWKSNPHPLSSEEREQWMNRLVPATQASLDEYQATVATCSALTAAQRNRLLDIDGTILVFLDIPIEVALERAKARSTKEAHWFHDEELIADQFNTLEMPTRTARTAVVTAQRPRQCLSHEVLTVANYLSLNLKLRDVAEEPCISSMYGKLE